MKIGQMIDPYLKPLELGVFWNSSLRGHSTDLHWGLGQHLVIK